MREKIEWGLFFVAVVVFSVWNLCTFAVDESEMGVVLRFGKPVAEYKTPGLKFKLPPPFNTVTYVEKRYFIYDSEPREIITSDRKTLVIDDFSPCRITNPTLFLQRTQTIQGAQERIDDIIYSHLRNKMGGYSFDEIVVTDRERILSEVTDLSVVSLSEYALETPMVRVNRVDLPRENKNSVVNRMISERKQQAKKYRAEGSEEGVKIMAETDRQVKEIVSQANRKQKEIRGQADAEATRIYNDAYKANPEFFVFYRSLQTTTDTLGVDGQRVKKKIIVDENHPLLKYIF